MALNPADSNEIKLRKKFGFKFKQKNCISANRLEKCAKENGSVMLPKITGTCEVF